jgi:hypothetical protein
MKRVWAAACILMGIPAAASAAPGLDDAVYGATVEAGKAEIETRYGRLMGGEDAGEDAFVAEAAYGFSPGVYGAALATLEREPGGNRRLETVAVEGIFTLGRIDSLGLDTAIYVEAEHGVHGPDNLETKLLVEHRRGRFDWRLNLVAEREVSQHAPVEFGYAASADFEVAEDLRIGAEAFGDLGTSDGLTTSGEHFIGPAMRVGFDRAGPGELELRTGYLLPVGRAHEGSKGQLRFGIEYEF